MSSSAPDAASILRPIERKAPTGVAAVFLYILVTLSAAMTGVGLRFMYAPIPALATAVEIASAVVMILILLYVWKGVPTAKGLLPAAVIGGGILVFFTSSLLPAAVLLSLIFAVGGGGFLISVLPKKALALCLLIPAAAYGITAAVTLDPLSGCLALIPFPALIALGLGTRHSASREDGLTRVGVICLTSVTLLVTLAVTVLLVLVLSMDGFRLESLPTYFEDFREAYIRELIAEYNLQLESLEIPPNTPPEVVEVLTQKMTYKEAANMVNTVVSLLPCVLITLINIIATLAQLLLQSALRAFGHEASITDRVKVFRMSLLSCVVFTVAFFGALGFWMDLIAGSESSLGGVIALNLCVILLPGLALAGLLRIVEWIKKKSPRGVGCLLTALIFIPPLWIIAPLVLPIVEVVGNVVSFIASKFTFDSDDDDENPFDRP